MVNQNVFTLKDRFFEHAATAQLAGERIAEFWQLIHDKYTEKGRYYHKLDHISALFNSFDQYKDRLTDPLVVSYAIWYHDIIYNARRNDNEEQSALLAAKCLSQLNLSEQQQVDCLAYIRATAKHLDVAADKDSDLAYFLDFDLAVLAWELTEYQQYAADIRKEYGHVPGFLYRRGRRKVLRYFLDAPFLFRTTVFRGKCEEMAKNNLRWELASL